MLGDRDLKNIATTELNQFTTGCKERLIDSSWIYRPRPPLEKVGSSRLSPTDFAASHRMAG
jgi:hypothetical protein